LSEVIGSWKTMPISRPRMRRSAVLGQLRQILTIEQDLPAFDPPGGSIRPRIEKPTTDLPPPGFAHEPHHLAPASGRS
jgi:hypothetical protein